MTIDILIVLPLMVLLVLFYRWLETKQDKKNAKKLANYKLAYSKLYHQTKELRNIIKFYQDNYPALENQQDLKEVYFAPPGRSYEWSEEDIVKLKPGVTVKHWVQVDGTAGRLHTFQKVKVLEEPKKIYIGGNLPGSVYKVVVQWFDQKVHTYVNYLSPETIEENNVDA